MRLLMLMWMMYMTNPVDQYHPRIQFTDPKTGLLTPFAFKWLNQVYTRIGGPDDAIVDIEMGEIYEPGITDSQLIQVKKDLEQLQIEFELAGTTSELTVIKKQLQDLQIELELITDNSRLIAIEKQLNDFQNEFDMSPIWQTNNFFTTKLFSESTNFTTFDNCIVIATSNITVTLNTNPKDQEKAIIKRNTTAGTVTISSSPINIDGAATYSLIANYEAAHCIYSATDNEWFIV